MDSKGVLDGLADALLPVLDLSFVHISWSLSGTAVAEVTRASPGAALTGFSDLVRHNGSHLEDRPAGQAAADLFRRRGEPVAVVSECHAGESYRIAEVGFGTGGACGQFTAGAQRPTFPTDAERLVMRVACNQAATTLERLSIEQQLRESEQELRRSRHELLDFTENAAIGLHWVGPDGMILWANKAELEMLGYGPEEYIGHHIAEFHADQEAIEEVLARLRCGVELRDHEVRLRCKDGSVKWGALTSNVRWEDGRFVHTRCFTRDITARKRAEEERRLTEERFASFMRHLPGAAWIKDAEGRYVYANDHAQRVFRTPMHQLQDRTDEQLFPPETARQFRENDLQAIELRRGIQTIEHLEHEDGVHSSVVSKFPMLDADSQVRYVGGVAIDITEQKRIEAALRESDARLQSILDNTAACVFAKDLDGRYTIANRSFLTLFGWSETDDVLGKTDDELHPRETAQRYVANDRQVLEAGKPLEFEEVANVPDGPPTYLMLKFPLRDHQGTPYGICGIATDITERKRAEEERARLLAAEQHAHSEAEAARQRYQELVNGLDAIVWEADARTWRFTFVSQQAEQILGYPVRRWLEEPSFWVNVIAPEDREHAVSICQKACAEGRDHDFEYRAVAADGRIVWLRDIVHIVPGDDGRPGHLRGVMVDVTRTKQLEFDLQQRAEQLAEADRRKDEFLALLGHELRNPLATVVNGVQILQSLGARDDQAAHVQSLIGRQSKHMTHLIDDLLDVTRISRGKIVLRKERLDLVELTRKAIDDYRRALDESGCDLEVRLPERPLWIEADPTRVHQLLGNLLQNGCKFTDAGGRITVALDAHSTERQAVVSIRDSGIGMTRETLDRLFVPFSQADSSLDRSRGGLGLGLALVKGIVELHGGTIHAHSPGLGQGSEFTVSLPVAAGSEPAQDDSSPPGSHGGSEYYRVLVVEDSAPVAEVFAMMLQGMGHEVEFVASGEDALQRLPAYRPQIVFSDISMPRMSGYELARRIREQVDFRDLVLVAMTGYGQPEDRNRALQAGFDHHLVKPADFDQLRALFATIASA